MSLTLVLGPANSAKAGEVLGAFALHSRRDAVLVVPTAADVAHYRAELAADGIVRGLILTPAGLAEEIARRAGHDARVISETVRRAVLDRVLGRIEWQALGDSAQGAGFAGAAIGLIAELERALVSPSRFAAAVRTAAGEDPGALAYAADLGRIVTGYAAELTRLEVEDAELFAWRGLDALRADPAGWGRTPVFFYGFDDLSRAERDAVETLARGVEVTVSLTYEAGREALRAGAEVVEALRAVADEVREMPAQETFYARPARDALHHLERSLFGPPVERSDPGEAVELLEAGGELAQAELVAAEALDLMARRQCPPEEIAIVCRNLDASGPVLRSALSAAGVPVEEERRMPFTHTALGRAVTGLARMAFAVDAEPRDLLAFLRYRARDGGARAEVDDFEADLRRGAVRDAQTALDRCPVADIGVLRGAADPAAALSAAARGLLASGRAGRAPLLDGAATADARALAVLWREVSELTEVLGPVDGAMLLGLLGRLEVPLGTGGSGGVRLAEPPAIRARRFRAVIVTGLNEGEFPRPAGGDPFLPDELRRRVAQASGLRLPLAGDPLDRERYLLYACVSRAGEWVRMAYRSSDEEGNLALPSPFLDEIAQLFAPGWSARARRRLLADVVWPADAAPSARERRRALAAAAGPTGDDGVDRTLSSDALARVRHTEVASANALESYLRCPMRWLVESQLGPRRFEPQPEPLARGSFLHEVLEYVFAGLGGPLGPDRLPAALGRLHEAIAAVPDRALAPGAADALRAALRAGLEADLRRYLEAEAADTTAFTPAQTELRFGFEEDDSLPALELGDGAGAIRVRGMIDRIDVDRTGRNAVVRDYKSGAARGEQAVGRWEQDGNLQVALYMLAVRRLLGLAPVAGVYQPLRGRDLRPRGVFLAGEPLGERLLDGDGRSAEELEAVLASAETRALEVVAAIRAGALQARPGTCSRDGCAHPGICRP